MQIENVRESHRPSFILTSFSLIPTTPIMLRRSAIYVLLGSTEDLESREVLKHVLRFGYVELLAEEMRFMMCTILPHDSPPSGKLGLYSCKNKGFYHPKSSCGEGLLMPVVCYTLAQKRGSRASASPPRCEVWHTSQRFQQQ